MRTMTILTLALLLSACTAGRQVSAPTSSSGAPPPDPPPVLPAPGPSAELAPEPSPPPTTPDANASPEPQRAKPTMVAREESIEAKGTVAELRARVVASAKQWQDAMRKHGGAYTYATDFSSWTGFGHQRQVTVADGNVIEHAYFAFDRHGKTTDAWVERGSSVGSHAKGTPPPTVDHLYTQCLDEVLTKDTKQHDFYVAFFGSGLLAYCTYRHKQCADDCSEGPEIHAIRWHEAARQPK